MKKNLIFIFNSIKQSIRTKPVAFILLLLIFFSTTICCCIPSRTITQSIVQDCFESCSFRFKTPANNLLETRITLGDYIRSVREQIQFEGEKVGSSLSVAHFDCNLEINNTPIKFDSISVIFQITGNKNITEENIENKQNVVAIPEPLAYENGIVVGDTIKLYGNDLKVRNIYSGYGDTFIIPYNLPINEWYSSIRPAEHMFDKPTEVMANGSITKINYKDVNHLKNKVKKLGYKIEFYMSTTPIAMIMLFSMLAVGILSTLSIINYWVKCNSKKYATYKTLGCSPKLLATAMIVETILIAIIAIGFGLIFDLILDVTMQSTYDVVITGYEWLHYLILIGGPMLSMISVSLIYVIKRAKAMPANTKYN